MTDHQCGRHADIHLLAGPLLLHHLLRLLCNRLQTVDEELRDTRNQFHHSTHRHTQEQHFLNVQLGHGTDQRSDNHTKHDRLAQHTKLLLQTLGIDIELREAGNLVKQPVDADGKGRKALTERLGNGDAIHIVVIALELRGRQIGHHQRVDVTHDGGEVAPSQTLVHHEVGHSPDKGEVPVVPKVDVDRTRTFGNKQQEVYAQTDGDDQRTHSRVISDSGGSRPAHVEHAELQVVKTRDLTQRTAEVVRQQGRHDAKANETDTHIKTRLERLSELHADAQSDNSK